MAPFRFALLSLALYRVARMAALEEGPGGPWAVLVGELLALLGRAPAPEDLETVGALAIFRGAYDPEEATWVGRGLNCPLCTGFWLAFLFALGLPQRGLGWLLNSLALAGAQTFIQTRED